MTLLWPGESVLSEPLSPLQLNDEALKFSYVNPPDISRQPI
jgi:hypothetical protein